MSIGRSCEQHVVVIADNFEVWTGGKEIMGGIVPFYFYCVATGFGVALSSLG